MKFLELGGTLTYSGRKINDINSIKAKIVFQFNDLRFRTDLTDNVITFKTIVIDRTSGFGYSHLNYLALRIYKEGKIVIKKEGKALKIRWTVKLDTLYVIVIDTSVVAGITSSLYLDTEPVISVSIGIAFFLVFIFLGIQFIKYRLSELINDSVYRN